MSAQFAEPTCLPKASRLGGLGKNRIRPKSKERSDPAIIAAKFSQSKQLRQKGSSYGIVNPQNNQPTISPPTPSQCPTLLS